MREQYERALTMKKRLPHYETEKFVAYFWFVGWDCISLGFHICLSKPNIELHLPFGFIKIGRP